jgi:hypothetical protein
MKQAFGLRWKHGAANPGRMPLYVLFYAHLRNLFLSQG